METIRRQHYGRQGCKAHDATKRKPSSRYGHGQRRHGCEVAIILVEGISCQQKPGVIVTLAIDATANSHQRFDHLERYANLQRVMCPLLRRIWRNCGRSWRPLNLRLRRSRSPEESPEP